MSCVDDMGFALKFQRTVRRPFTAAPDLTNAPGSPPQRPVNSVGITPDMPAVPRTLSHVVLFVPDAARAEAFYERLGFRTTDRFTGTGPFMRPAGTVEHHTLFMIQAPPFMKGCEHFTFHVGSGTEVLLAGTASRPRVTRRSGGRGVTCSAPTGSGTSTVRSAVTSNTMLTWTSTMIPGRRAKRRLRRIRRSCFCSRGARSGFPAEGRPRSIEPAHDAHSIPEHGSPAVRLCRLDELTVGTARGFEPEHTGMEAIVVLRKGEGCLPTSTAALIRARAWSIVRTGSCRQMGRA